MGLDLWNVAPSVVQLDSTYAPLDCLRDITRRFSIVLAPRRVQQTGRP